MTSTLETAGASGNSVGANPGRPPPGGYHSGHNARPAARDPRMQKLLALAADALGRGRPLVWCQVVQTRGSTPQKAGAAMLVFAEGGQAGTLGGGCVEAEVARQALASLHAD